VEPAATRLQFRSIMLVYVESEPIKYRTPKAIQCLQS
jgi:hypothetical protein